MVTTVALMVCCAEGAGGGGSCGQGISPHRAVDARQAMSIKASTECLKSFMGISN